MPMQIRTEADLCKIGQELINERNAFVPDMPVIEENWAVFPGHPLLRSELRS